MRGCRKGVESLIHAGADVEAKSNDGHTPLMYSIGLGRVEVLKTLLRRGSNANAIIREDIIVRTNNFDACLEIIKQHKKCWQPFWEAYCKEDFKLGNLTLEDVMGLLSIWPLENPKAKVPRLAHMEVIFRDSRWKPDIEEHRAGLVQEVPGIHPRDRLYLLGGAAVRKLLNQSSRLNL